MGDAAEEIGLFVAEEKIQFARIMNNVENITANLKKSNETVTEIIGNTKKISDDLVSADFKSVITEADSTIQKLNMILGDIQNGSGSMSKLIHDDALYNELVESNKKLQDLVEDLKLHPERYIHFSIMGSKTKGASLSPREEKKLRMILDTIQD